ncbi:MAG: hypothetical protein K0R57_1422 [Paenibacillaceae bacterium]|jgi:hypothetical protein|nr:hypothetical protein [Paenibacillaceae bacterium]
MDELMRRYNGLILEEDTLYKRIEVCQECVDLVLDYLSEKAETIHLPTAEGIISTIHIRRLAIETELLQLRIEKGVLNSKICRMRRNK